jgi:hypothetical protein
MTSTVLVIGGWYILAGLCWQVFNLLMHDLKYPDCRRCDLDYPSWALAIGFLVIAPMWPLSVYRWVRRGFGIRHKGQGTSA